MMNEEVCEYRISNTECRMSKFEKLWWDDESYVANSKGRFQPMASAVGTMPGTKLLTALAVSIFSMFYTVRLKNG